MPKWPIMILIALHIASLAFFIYHHFKSPHHKHPDRFHKVQQDIHHSLVNIKKHL